MDKAHFDYHLYLASRMHMLYDYHKDNQRIQYLLTQ